MCDAMQFEQLLSELLFRFVGFRFNFTSVRLLTLQKIWKLFYLFYIQNTAILMSEASHSCKVLFSYVRTLHNDPTEIQKLY